MNQQQLDTLQLHNRLGEMSGYNSNHLIDLDFDKFYLPEDVILQPQFNKFDIVVNLDKSRPLVRQVKYVHLYSFFTFPDNQGFEKHHWRIATKEEIQRFGGK